jgi:hypothetical protein
MQTIARFRTNRFLSVILNAANRLQKARIEVLNPADEEVFTSVENRDILYDNVAFKALAHLCSF